ncbi:unnamed protein product [Auanema sp. JU1783]|nr:unnamed protein product [Auanema sp. JU1783]
MKQFLVLALLPALSYATVQCYVGQKLFSYESNNAVCAKFIPYACAADCEWKKDCSEHHSYSAFKGRRTFVSGLLINSKSLMVLCCASLATRVEADNQGRDKCVWRDAESISVLGPSIRTNPVLAPNHYIRDIRLERDGTARVDVQLEVCQYQDELTHCIVDKMTEAEKRRYSFVKQRLDNSKSPANVVSTIQKTGDDQKNPEPNIISQKATNVCSPKTISQCGRDIQSQISACCKDRAACDRGCLKSVEQSLIHEKTEHVKGCTIQEVQETIDCLGRLVNTQV